MAKRKRKPGNRPAFQVKPVKNYRSDEYVMYIKSAETGILQAATIDSALTDGEVDTEIQTLIKQLQTPQGYRDLFSPQEADEDEDSPIPKEVFVRHFILLNLRQTFEEYPPLEAEDLVGVLKVIRSSIKHWGRKDRRHGYLTFLEGFMADLGTTVQRRSEEEAKEMGLDKLEPPQEIE